MKRLMRDEKGQALLATLLLLLIGTLIVTPTLHFMGTGVSSGRVYEQKIDEIYAADSGVEDALWHIRNDTIVGLLGGDYDEYDYSTPYPYPYNLSVNGKNVSVTIQNVWIPKDIPNPSPPTPSEAKQIIADEKLIIVGYPSSTASTYTIKIVYNWDTTTHRDALRVETIGIWLSPGFEYVMGSSTFEKASGQLHSDPAISLYKGGYAVVWTFASPPRLRQDFPPTTDTSNPLVRTFTFQYTSPEAGQIPELVSSWVDTKDVTGITYSWDDSIRLYKIVSQAGRVQIEAYGAKTKFRKLKSTISSDYTVAGNNLMEHTQSGGGSCYLERYRDKLYAERDSTIQSLGIEQIPESGIVPPGKIPEEAIIDHVYLYWTGWIDYHYYYYSSGSGWWDPPGWKWGEITALKHPSNPTYEQLETLVETSAKVNMVKFDVDGYAQTVTTHDWQTTRTSDCSGAQYSWVYSCFQDVTDVVVSGGMTVREYLEEAMKSDGSGQVTFTVGHADEVRNLSRPGYANYYFSLDGDGSTGYPLATPAHKTPSESCYQTRYQWTYADWSLIIFYRSPALPQRQLYLFDDLRYISYSSGGEDPEFEISGFLAPPVITEGDKSHLTYFVGEGDPHYQDSYIEVNDMYLSDPPDNPENNVFNSYSNAIPQQTTDGADIDTFELPEGCILPYDASAEVTLITTEEIYVLVYIVLSFRSDLTTGGIITNYTVKIS